MNKQSPYVLNHAAMVDLALVDFFEENTIEVVRDRAAYMAHISRNCNPRVEAK